MALTFVCYPICSTCKKAAKWLCDHGIEYTVRHIKDERPLSEELTLWHSLSGAPLKKFFNTSGLVYRDMALKSKLPTMSEQAQLELLAHDGMLVKRPLLVGDAFVLIGFKESEWAEKLL